MFLGVEHHHSGLRLEIADNFLGYTILAIVINSTEVESLSIFVTGMYKGVICQYPIIIMIMFDLDSVEERIFLKCALGLYRIV